MSAVENSLVRPLALVVALGIAAGGQVACYAATTAPKFDLVALTGTAAPAGGNFNLFERPQINEAGQVAFVARVFDGVHEQQNGIFVGAPGALDDLALQYTPAPAGGNFYSFNQFVLNDAGQVAFRGALIGGTSYEGIFAGEPGSVQTIAVNGTPAPDGGQFISFQRDIAFNDAGQIAFPANLADGDRLFGGTPGNLFTIAATGQSPVDSAEHFAGFLSPMLNNSGSVAFRAALDPTASRTGMYAGAPGNIQTLAASGAAAVGGGTIDTLSDIRGFNSSGQAGFFATLVGGASIGGYFVGTPGSVQPLALLGAPAPGGGEFSIFGGGVPMTLSEAGAAGISAGISGAGYAAASFFGAPGALLPVVIDGLPAPGGGVFASASLPGSNSSDILVFYAGLTGPGVTANNNNGLYARIGRTRVKLLREGDQLPVNDGSGETLRTVANSGIEFAALTSTDNGRGQALTDSGYLAVELTFTDNSSAIYRIQLPTIPEPSSGLLVLFALAAASWQRRAATTRYRRVGGSQSV